MSLLRQVSDSACWEFTGELFLPADILIFTQSKPACWMVSTSAQNSPNLKPVPAAKMKFRRGELPRRGFCPSAASFLCQTVPSDDTLVFWAVTTAFLVLDWEKQTCRYSPLKEARAARPIGRVSWPLSRFPSCYTILWGPKWLRNRPLCPERLHGTTERQIWVQTLLP